MSSTSQVIFSSQPRKLKLLFVLPSINTCCPVFPLHINLLGRDVLLLVFHFRVFYRRTVRLPRRPAVAGDRKKPNPDRPAIHWLDSSAVMPVARRCCALVVTLPCELCRDAFPGKFLATAGRSLVGGAPWKPIFAFGGLGDMLVVSNFPLAVGFASMRTIKSSCRYTHLQPSPMLLALPSVRTTSHEAG